MENQKLKQYFVFDESDLQMNRKGNLSEKQKLRFKALELGTTGKLIALAIGLAILIGTSQPLISAVQSNKTTSPTSWIVAVVWLLVGLVIDWWLLRRIMLQGKHQLAKVEGRAEIITTSGERNSIYYELHVGGQEFSLDQGVTDAIVDGQTYTIYYRKPNNDILSVEKLLKTE